ncbi:nuclear autoantigenic sperm protein, putative [Pediculus humanus corporis]|uniref:Nuclear autoantigenic sperm protein, putative n=1 Tax=Pediculus humanus subsp. corporis TaxID=121224 RepID=E0VU41_PEDHC|nr:nuclear autoantigenic sperm protein, putative [Pediculus humanus corporis]EEB16897.1 nuclear autoantigenic sperm protein, putative [Pediculus humanus corporis]
MADNSKSEKPEEVSVSPQADAKVTKNDNDNVNNIEEEKEKIKKKATLLFLQGKRSLYIKDFQAAATALSESCQLFSQIYSEQDDEMADPYFYYGKALLEVGRSESEVLEEGEEDDEDEENENEAKTGDENVKENNKDSVTNSNSKTVQENGEKSDSVLNQDPQTNNETENDDVNDLQLSWEYLELARLIYSRKSNTVNCLLFYFQTILCLGENGIESENYSVAIEDLKEALNLQKKHLSEVDRRIAETYYQLGIAHSLCQGYDEAIENFKMAVEQLNKKISSLEMRQKMGDKKTEEEEKDAFYTMDGEIKEIKGVIQDVEEKIKDMADCKNQVRDELIKQVVSGRGEEKNQPGSSTSNSNAPPPTNSIPASDISHLIKKKRKNDDETIPEKKLKTD